MINRILDISEGGFHLAVKDRQLTLRRDLEKLHSIPLSDIAVLILGTTWLSCTQAVLSGLAEQGGMIIVCDGRGLPIAMLSPIYGHSLQSQKLNTQIAASLPLKKNLWKHIVAAKVNNQGLLLKHLYGDDSGLIAKSLKVRSGDAGNIEAIAARTYWQRLFPDLSFRRTPGCGKPPNHYLDYGYAVLRAIVARAVCGSGLNPSLGLHHHHRDNSFCLADDLMEPFRPLIDHAVVQIVGEGKVTAPLDKELKAKLLQPLFQRYSLDGKNRTLFDIATIMSASIVTSYNCRTCALLLPEPLAFM